MDIEIIIEKNKKDFKVLKNNSVILKGSKPKAIKPLFSEKVPANQTPLPSW